MRSDNGNARRAASARGFMALFAALAMGLGLMAWPAEAAPFAYVANGSDITVSVIDTATNTVVATVPAGGVPIAVAVTPDGTHAYVAIFDSYFSQQLPGTTVSVIAMATNTVVATVVVGFYPAGVAITPDGKHVYVSNEGTNNVSVIDTATNTVVATLAVGVTPVGVAITPDGTHVYVTNGGGASVSVIDTATNTVVATLAVGNGPFAVAVTPDGLHSYVTNSFDKTVSVIDTATNTVEAATLAVGNSPQAVAITPDGKHAYVTNEFSNSVSVIDTATNTVEAATLAVGMSPVGVAITPDGKHAYVANGGSFSVSVIDTATNTVEATTIPVGNFPNGVGIVPPPPGVPFLVFSAPLLEIAFGTAPNTDAFVLRAGFTLSNTAPMINPPSDAVALQIGTFAVTIPPGSFTKNHLGDFILTEVINGVTLEAVIKATGALQYVFQAKAQGASFTGTQNMVYVTLTIGGDSGATSVTAQIFH